MDQHRFLVCDHCNAGIRTDSRDTFARAGIIDDTNKCMCGGRFKEIGADEAVGAGGALDVIARRLAPAETIAEALTQLSIAQTAHGAGDDGSAWSAVGKALRILRAGLQPDGPTK